ncbi:DUF3180 domain-containing protein [Arcanobacterium buesumense]|uniref:DUF3180 domain-containing protein n=1 Tax=Arcanobacterium buesumense TaxID=2722751 RepID=A0A6H2EI88_9ACTO|nr:DUF3180 domain-containing protein [Arcanobacterium buesumense]QJC21278.1 DUF3180 domain-containing protein [Arcanobacterium buesumense]
MEADKRNELEPTSWLWLATVVIVSAAVSFFATDAWLGYGNLPPLFPVFTFLVPLLVTIFMLWQGWRVRSYRKGNRMLSMLSAARIWLLSQAVSRTGAITSGLCAGVVVSYLRYSHSDVMIDQAIIVSSAGVASMLMMVAGMIAETWCKNDDDDEPVPPAAAA